MNRKGTNMSKITLAVFTLYFCFNRVHLSQITDSSDTNFDIEFVTFSQHWPVTQCKYWTYKVHPGGKCVFPNKKSQWTVHGIWPKIVEEYSENCNNSWPLDIELMKSLERELDQAWTNIYKETGHYSFWEHEWSKHGTCATVLEPFDSQLKYFIKAIEWNRKYSLADMLETAGIFPSDTKELTPDELADAVKAKTKRDPMIVCEPIHEEQYLDELRICFDKQLNVIDCVPVVDITCDVHKGIIYPANV